MTITINLATDKTILWPALVDGAPEGWHWGSYVSLNSSREGYYMIRDADDATLIAIQRPDLGEDDVPTASEIREALVGEG